MKVVNHSKETDINLCVRRAWHERKKNSNTHIESAAVSKSSEAKANANNSYLLWLVTGCQAVSAETQGIAAAQHGTASIFQFLPYHHHMELLFTLDTLNDNLLFI